MVIKIPKFKTIHVKNVVFDYNGTIATGGKVSQEVFDEIIQLTKVFNVFIVTADTFGTVQKRFMNTAVEIYIVDHDNGIGDKAHFIQQLGSEHTIALGNGNNDYQMLKESAIGISVLGEEGLSVKSLNVSDLIIKNILDFFEMIKQPKKLIATLRQ